MVDVIGWFGTLLYLANHAYLSFAKAHNKTLYFGFNALAAASLVLSSFYLASWQAVWNNGFWLLVSVLLLLKINVQRLPIHARVFYIIFGLCLIWLLYDFVQAGRFNVALLSWSSVLCFGMAYLLMSSAKISVLEYLAWNVYAALAFLPQLWLDRNIPVWGLELCWAAISLFGIVQRLRPAAASPN